MLNKYYGPDANESNPVDIRSCDPLTRKEYNQLEKENFYLKQEIAGLKGEIERRDNLVKHAIKLMDENVEGWDYYGCDIYLALSDSALQNKEAGDE